MILKKIKLKGFQSFGDVTELELSAENYVLGPNGSGKTAVLQALCRMFAYDSSLRKIKNTDFYTPLKEESVVDKTLWIEAEFSFPELSEENPDQTAIPPNFNHMSLLEIDGVPQVRIRLNATLFTDGEIEEELLYVIASDEQGEPVTTSRVPRADRNNIQVHYIPALRDPNNHITYSAGSYIGRVLKAINWVQNRDKVKDLTSQISDELTSNESVVKLSESLTSAWQQLHKGDFFTKPKVNFIAHEIEALLKNLSLSFLPGHGESEVESSRLSDGHKSLLYLSIVFAVHNLSRKMLLGHDVGLDLEKFKPPVFTILAIEEPENSLAPQYLGRIMKLSNRMVEQGGAQVLMATHSPSIVRRVDPKNILFLRLDESRQSKVKKVLLPQDDIPRKYIKEAVHAFPELYFSKLVVLGEGDTEEIIIPRLLRARDQDIDEGAISVVPLGGRHVNHFWRLLNELEIPHITLLDLDLSRYGAGWGRIKYVCDQLMVNSPPDELKQSHINGIEQWNSQTKLDRNHGWFNYLETKGVFFSSPMDLDFSMLKSFQDAYGVVDENKVVPDQDVLNTVLGTSHFDSTQYDEDELSLFPSYKSFFKGKSKPVSHLEALSKLSDQELSEGMPAELARLTDFIIKKLEGLPE